MRKSGLRYEIEYPQGSPQKITYWIFTATVQGPDSNPFRPEYLCKMSGDRTDFKVLATRTLYWERDGTFIESEWKRVSGTATTSLPCRGEHYNEAKNVSKAKAVAILLSARGKNEHA